MKPHVFHPGAAEEYVLAVQYYAAIHSELGARFNAEIEKLVSEVCWHPERYLQFSPPVRRARSRKFPYSLVFLDQTDRVWIVAVMHAKRRPEYWRNRLN